MIGHPLLLFSTGTVDGGREVPLRSVVVVGIVETRVASFTELLEQIDALEDGMG
jgi:hypothetical protein